MAEQANAVFAGDKPPPQPWTPTDADDERWSERRLEADLLMGTRWPFFRDRRLDGPPDPASGDGRQPQAPGEQEHPV